MGWDVLLINNNVNFQEKGRREQDKKQRKKGEGVDAKRRRDSQAGPIRM